MKKITCLIILLFVHALARADFDSNARGTTTANFLKLGVGARAEAMGEAYSAVTEDATSLYWNPAGLARLDNAEATFMHAPYLASTYYDYGAYAKRFGNQAFGIGIQYFSAGSILETDNSNTILGSFSPYDLAATMGYAYRFSEEGLAFGVSGKYIQSKILNTASTFAADLGIQSRWYGDRLRLAFTTVNIGGKMKFEQDSESLPLAFRYGAAYKITSHWLASTDLVSPKDNQTYLALGTEYGWRASDGVTLAGRLGYNSLTSGDISGVTGLAFGFGVGYGRLAFDYAFLPYGGLGITQRISLSFKFGAPAEESNVVKPRNVRRSQYEEDDLENILKK
jgi:hypothetical protein